MFRVIRQLARRGLAVSLSVWLALSLIGPSVAAACEGAGEEHAESTTLSTKLSGESREGEEITALDGSPVKDRATLSGRNASKATGTVSYKIYSDKECKTLVTSAGEVTVSGESVPASSEEELEGGKTYYWQAHYGGDAKNAESTSSCTEILKVTAVTCRLPYCETTITPGVSLTITGIGNCTASSMMRTGTELFLLTAGHCLEKESSGTQTVEQRMSSAWPKEATVQKEIGRSVTFNYNTRYDIAEVKIEDPRTWLLATGGAPPLLVEWEATPKVTSVVGEATNRAGEATCISGAVSGLQCGKVLQVGVTQELQNGRRVENLIETNVKVRRGDSGAPEFVQTRGGVLIQGTAVNGEGRRTWPETSGALKGTLTMNSSVITRVTPGTETCEKIAEYNVRWTPGPEVTTTGTGIPAETTVSTCRVVGVEAEIRMSAAATQTGSRTLTLGYANIAGYEPMSQIRAVFTGQTLVMR